MVKKVAIIGAGASGLLLTHYLLKRQDYQIDIYERHGDPRLLTDSKSRTYPLALNDRGMKALGQISGLIEAVKAYGHEIVASVSHSYSGRQRVIPRDKSLTTIDRLSLIKVLLNSLDTNRLKIHFQHPCVRVDLAAKQAHFATPTGNLTVDYDLIIGADGARSVVRKAFLDIMLFECQQRYVSDDYKTLFLPLKNIEHQLDADKIHTWRTDNGIVIILVPQCDGSLNGVIHFPRSDLRISQLVNVRGVIDFFEQNFPAVARLMTPEDAKAFLNRPIGSNLTIRCNRYHHDNNALLIGDAAHAVSPALGQGCNSALEDVSILNALLEEYNDELSQVLTQFTARRLPDTRAVVELSDYSLPSQKSLFVEFILRMRIAQFLHQLFPQKFLPPLFQAMHDPNISYGEIYNRYGGWCKKVKRSKTVSSV